MWTCCGDIGWILNTLKIFIQLLSWPRANGRGKEGWEGKRMKEQVCTYACMHVCKRERETVSNRIRSPGQTFYWTNLQMLCAGLANHYRKHQKPLHIFSDIRQKPTRHIHSTTCDVYAVDSRFFRNVRNAVSIRTGIHVEWHSGAFKSQDLQCQVGFSGTRTHN